MDQQVQSSVDSMLQRDTAYCLVVVVQPSFEEIMLNVMSDLEFTFAY